MNKTQTLMVFVMSSLVLASCMKISKKGANQQNANPTVSEVKSVTPVEPLNQFQKKVVTKLEFEITNEDIQFLFPLDWPESLFVEVIDQEQRTTIPIHLNSENKLWTFKWPGKDRKFGFIFRSNIDKNILPLKTVEALPPLDITTSDDIDVVAKFGINTNFEKIVFSRLHLLKSAKLYLSTFSGELVLNEVYSEAGSIQTFPTNFKAALDTDGVSGGRVEFKILSGEGHLSLMALGQHGGDGSGGLAPNESLRGRQGHPGRLAEFGPPEYCNPISNTFCFATIYPCAKDPTNSADGGQGLKGFTGFPGRNGGSSGLYSIVTNSSQVKTNVVAKEGKGGRGGYGGAGGEGGYGGDIGDGAGSDLLIGKFKFTKEKVIADQGRSLLLIRFDPACNPAIKGGIGPTGLPGDPGADGLDGVNEILLNKN